MSWSDDTRCLYCEGRLPLYRKITHGQFCSSAHRKAYWQEHERLAVERLHQTHSSLRSYRSLEVHQEAVPYPDLEPETQVRVAAGPELEIDLDQELDPAPSFDVSLYPIPDRSEPPIAASELLSLLEPEFLALDGSSAELVAADPFEYEITLQPLPPSHASGLSTSPLPEGSPVAVWSHVPSPAPQALATWAADRKSSAAEQSEVELCHPRSQEPAAGILAAGRLGLPLTAVLESRSAATATESNLEVLRMEPAPVTSVALEVPPQSDVLLQLLDQQVPHPDQLHALGQFAAHQPALAIACPPPQQFDVTVDTALPPAATLPADRRRLPARFQHRNAAALERCAARARTRRKPHRYFRDCRKPADGEFRGHAGGGISPPNGHDGTSKPWREPVRANARRGRAPNNQLPGVRPFDGGFVGCRLPAHGAGDHGGRGASVHTCSSADLCQETQNRWGCPAR